MYTSSYVISPQTDNPLAVLAKRIEEPDLCLRIIEDFPTGRPGSKTTYDELEDPTLPFNLSPDTAIDADEVECTQRSLTGDDDQIMFPFENCASNSVEYEVSEMPVPTHMHYRQPKASIPSTCRGILWYLNTPQCRRAALLRVFDEAGFNAQTYVGVSGTACCCDRHTPIEQLPQDLQRLFPSPLILTAEYAVGTDVDSDLDSPPVAVGKTKFLTVDEWKLAHRKICDLRNEIWTALGYRKLFYPFLPSMILSDKNIDTLLMSLECPIAPEQVKTVPTQRKLCRNRSVREYSAHIVAIINSSTQQKSYRGQPAKKMNSHSSQLLHYLRQTCRNESIPFDTIQDILPHAYANPNTISSEGSRPSSDGADSAALNIIPNAEDRTVSGSGRYIQKRKVCQHITDEQTKRTVKLKRGGPSKEDLEEDCRSR